MRTYRPLSPRDDHIDREVDIGTINDWGGAPSEPLSLRLVVECRLGARTVLCQFAHCLKNMEVGTRWGEKTEVLRTCTSKGKLQVWPVDSLPKRPIRPASFKPGDVIRSQGDVNGSQGDVIGQRNAANGSQGDVIDQQSIVNGSQGDVIDQWNVTKGSQDDVIAPWDVVIRTPDMTSSQSASSRKANINGQKEGERSENDLPKKDYEGLRFPRRDDRGVCEAGKGDIELGGKTCRYGDGEEGEEEKEEEPPRPISRPNTPRRVSFAPTEQVPIAQSILGRNVHGSLNIYTCIYVCMY